MEYTTFEQRPHLRRPVLIAAFEGWNDAGEAATAALGYVADALDGDVIGRVDPEEFYDFQQTRPTVRIDDDDQRHLDWPAVTVTAVHLPDADHDLVVLQGSEPNLRWRTFATEVLGIADALDVELLVTLGALFADVPHTRPVQVMASTPDEQLAAKLGLAASRYEGPTGMLGVLGDAARRAGIPTISLWAALPHYVQAQPNPRATLALVDRLTDLLPVEVDTETLREATDAFDATVADIVGEDPELLTYVERLEAEADKEAESGATDLAEVPPEQFVAEVEQFLRDQPGGSRS